MGQQLTPAKGFSALFEVLELADVLQLLHQTRRSATVMVDAAGSVEFVDGELVHAEAGDLQGPAALQALLNLPNGQVTVHGCLRRPHNVEGSFQAVLLDAMRRLDEHWARTDAEPTARAVQRPRPLGAVHHVRSAGTGAFDFKSATPSSPSDPLEFSAPGAGGTPAVPHSQLTPPGPVNLYRFNQLPAKVVEIGPIPPLRQTHRRPDAGMLVALAVSCMLLGMLLAMAVLDIPVA